MSEMQWVIGLLLCNAWLSWSLHTRIGALIRMGQRGEWPAPERPKSKFDA